MTTTSVRPHRGPWLTLGALVLAPLGRLLAEGFVRQGLAESRCCYVQGDLEAVESWLAERRRSPLTGSVDAGAA